MKIEGSAVSEWKSYSVLALKLKIKKVLWITITKTTMGVIFNLQNYHLLTLFLPTEEILQAIGKNWPAANLSFVDFRSQPRRNAITKATEYVAFGFSFRMLVFFKEGLNATVCERYGFFSVLAAVIQENGEVGVLSAWPSSAKCQWRVSCWLAISNTREKILYLITCVLTAVLGAGNPCLTL